MKKRALLSVSDKTGLVALAQTLEALDYEILSTGGTMKTLEEAGVRVKSVSSVTGFPEIMDGRVKTLHPLIHGGILARPIPSHLEAAQAHGIGLIDLVVVNLYPFQETIARPGISREEAIEQIDIGGPAMVRAAAKNHERVCVVVNPDRYPAVMEALQGQGEIPLKMRQALAKEAFAHTAAYDASIAAYL